MKINFKYPPSYNSLGLKNSSINKSNNKEFTVLAKPNKVFEHLADLKEWI